MITSSGLQGATATVFTGGCHIMGIMFVGDTATEPTLTVYDNTSAAGTVVAFAMVSDENHTFFAWFGERGIRCVNGIHAVLSAATGDYVIYYDIRP